MTLGDMAALVCAKTRQSDSTALARCKQFLRQRYEMIWAEEMWNDSLFRLEFSFNMSASALASDLPFANFFSRDVGIWHLPPTVDRILALRRTDQGVGVADHFRFYRDTLDAFEQTGAPVGFEVLGGVFADLRGKLTTVEAQGVVLSSPGGDENAVVRVVYLDFDGEEQILTSEALEAGYSNTFYPQVIQSVSKPTTNSAVQVVVDGDVIGTVAASAQVGKRYPRIQLLPMPVVTTDFKALVKQKPLRLEDDNDEPALRGVENCLMEYAQADMLERARQYSKAQLKRSEADALLLKLKKTEVAQEANHCQIVPEVSEVSGTVGYHHSKGYI